MEKTLCYALVIRIRIGRYMQDGRSNIDNNFMGQVIRPIALRRRNYPFCGSNEGAENNATFYTFMVCYREAGIDPCKWTKGILSKPLFGITEEELMKILPSNFK